jgi:hypothetical protein
VRVSWRSVLKSPGRALRESDELSHGATVNPDLETLTGLDPPEHVSRVVAEVANRDLIHGRDVAHQLQAWVEPAQDDIDIGAARGDVMVPVLTWEQGSPLRRASDPRRDPASAGGDQDHAGHHEPDNDHRQDDPPGDQAAIVELARASVAEIGPANLEAVGARDGWHQILLNGLTPSIWGASRRRAHR